MKKIKAIRLGEMIKWWTKNNKGSFNTELYLRVVYVKTMEDGNQTLDM